MGKVPELLKQNNQIEVIYGYNDVMIRRLKKEQRKGDGDTEIARKRLEADTKKCIFI